jgi:hypothetical protein
MPKNWQTASQKWRRLSVGAGLGWTAAMMKNRIAPSAKP